MRMKNLDSICGSCPLFKFLAIEEERAGMELTISISLNREICCQDGSRQMKIKNERMMLRLKSKPTISR